MVIYTIIIYEYILVARAITVVPNRVSTISLDLYYGNGRGPQNV